MCVLIALRVCIIAASGPEPKPVLSGNSRTFRVWMDTNQYQRDMARVVKEKRFCMGGRGGPVANTETLCLSSRMYMRRLMY